MNTNPSIEINFRPYVERVAADRKHAAQVTALINQGFSEDDARMAVAIMVAIDEQPVDWRRADAEARGR